MSIKINFPHKPTPEDLERIQKDVDRFSKVSFGNFDQAMEQISKAKNQFDIIACKFCESYRHDKIMAAIRKQERIVKNKEKKPDNN